MRPLLDNFFNPQILAQYGPAILGGFGTTVAVALLTILVGVGSGLILAIVRTIGIRPADIVITIFVDVFRTLPQLVVIVFFYFGLPYAGIQLSPFAATGMSQAKPFESVRLPFSDSARISLSRHSPTWRSVSVTASGRALRTR